MTVILEEKIIRGKKIRTNNNNIEKIIDLWSGVSEMKLSGDVFAVYSNYDNDFRGDFDLLIGSEIADFVETSTILAGKYFEIPVLKTNPEGVGEAWKEIWEDKELAEKRTYQTDIEQYRADGSISIYLSI